MKNGNNGGEINSVSGFTTSASSVTNSKNMPRRLNPKSRGKISIEEDKSQH